MTYWYWVALGWAVCGFLAYGRFLAQVHNTRSHPLDRAVAFSLSVWGPISLLATLSLCRHGFMWRLPPRKDG